MRPSSERFLSLITATLTAACLAGATDTQAQTPDGESGFHLHQSFKPCGKKWLKRASRLTEQQREWMLRREHRLYTLRAADRILATFELLSTASFRDCDVAEKWAARETTVRVVYLGLDGSRRTKLFHFADDEIFFDRQPRFYPTLGKALLRGVDREGRELSRWLPLDRLAAMLADLRGPAAAPAAAPVATLADVTAAAAAPAGGM